MIKKGDVFYKAWVNLEHKEPSTTELDEFHVTQVNKNGIYLTEKNCFQLGQKIKEKWGLWLAFKYSSVLS